MADIDYDEKKYRKELRDQLVDALGKVVYTYTAHHKMCDGILKKDAGIRVCQIVLTAISTVGFLSLVITNQAVMTWIGGISAALSLGLNLYTKDAKLQVEAQKHKNAADDLWEVREQYTSLIVDLEVSSEERIREERDRLTKTVSEINRKYPKTNRRGYVLAQKALKEEEEQTFNVGEAESFLPTSQREKGE